jgi:hypothetical protein
MDPLFAAEVWHYWLSFALLGPALLLLVGLGLGYLLKVVSAKHPKQQ